MVAGPSGRVWTTSVGRKWVLDGGRGRGVGRVFRTEATACSVAGGSDGLLGPRGVCAGEGLGLWVPPPCSSLSQEGRSYGQWGGWGGWWLRGRGASPACPALGQVKGDPQAAASDPGSPERGAHEQRKWQMKVPPAALSIWLPAGLRASPPLVSPPALLSGRGCVLVAAVKSETLSLQTRSPFPENQSPACCLLISHLGAGPSSPGCPPGPLQGRDGGKEAGTGRPGSGQCWAEAKDRSGP